jgi:hypothetical protein
MPMPTERKHFRRSIPISCHAALLHLREAYAYAVEFRQSVWEYSVGMDALFRLGLRDTDLQRLLRDRRIEQGSETTKAGRHTVHRTSKGVTPKSRFILTKSGLVLANECARITGEIEMDIDKPRATRPQWSRELGELRYYRNLLVKGYHHGRAPNQEALLDTFQTRGWPRTIQNPFSAKGDVDWVQRLKDATKGLNHHQVTPLIRFRGDGSGEACMWEPDFR